MESCTQIGHWRTMLFVPASAQSDSRLYCAAETEINSIVTVGVPLTTLAFSQDPNSRAGPSPPEQNPDWKRITLFDCSVFPCHDYPVNCRNPIRVTRNSVRRCFMRKNSLVP